MMELSIIIYIQQKINVVTMNQVYLGGSNIVFHTCTTYIVNPGATAIGQADVTWDLFICSYNMMYCMLAHLVHYAKMEI